MTRTVDKPARVPAVFLDRDGTIIADREYLSDPARISLLPGATEGLRHLAAAGFPLVVITNQSGVNRGYFPFAAVTRVHKHLAALLEAEGVAISGWYVCRHRPDEACGCRKPAAGMILQACRDLHLDANRSFVVGDRLSDLGAAAAAGSRGILIASSASLAEDPASPRTEHAKDLIEASRIIMSWQARNESGIGVQIASARCK